MRLPIHTPYDRAICIKVLTPEKAVVIESHVRGVGLRQYIWTRATLRKPKRCARCWLELPKRAGAFRPITNREERPDRLCLQCVADIVAGLSWDKVEKARVHGRNVEV